MNTEELEKNLVLLDDLFANDRLYNKLKDISTNIIFPFRKELENNLLGQTKEVQTSLIRTYVAKLQVLQKNFSLSTEFLFNGSPDKYSQTGYLYTFRDGTRRALSEYEIYLYESHWVFIILINELQRVCIINEIDFVKICTDLALSLIYINRHTTEDIFNDNILLEFTFNGNEVLPISQTNPPPPVKTFPEYFHPDTSKVLPDAIKTAFAKDTPSTLGVLIYTLQKEHLLIIDHGKMKAFHIAMKEFFEGVDIGKRQNYSKTEITFKSQYGDVILNCKTRIDKILK